ncbi:uncharacterized protein LOC108179569, partial [Tachysurus ichikawai]
ERNISHWVTIANVPPFIPDEDIERELKRYRKVASKVRTVYLGCKNGGLKKVKSFRRHVFMVLNQPELDVSFRVVCEGRSFMLYASTGQMKCFECGDVGHKRLVCPHKAQASEGEAGQSNVVAGGTETVEPPVKHGADFPAVSSAVSPEVSGTESGSAVAAMSNTDIHVEKRAEVSITNTNPVSGEVVINTGCTESTVQAEISAHNSNTELDSEDVMVNTQEITVGEGNVMMEENSDSVMMETEQVAFKTPIKREKIGKKATHKYAKKTDQEAVESESDTGSDVVVPEPSVPIPAVSNIFTKEYNVTEIKHFLKITKKHANGQHQRSLPRFKAAI